MKLKIYSLTLILYGIFCLKTAHGQRQLDKNEILIEFQKIRKVPTLDSIVKSGFPVNARPDLQKLISKNVDTLVVYSCRFPGAQLVHQIRPCSALANTYFFWKENGEYFSGSAERKCLAKESKSPEDIIRFTSDQFVKLKDEFFMEAISGAEKTDDKIKFYENFVHHEGKYTLLMIINGQHNYLEFDDNSLNDKKSLFIDYNKSLASFKLFELVTNSIN